MKSALISSLACLLSLGCSSDVRVVDQNGNPVEGAVVEPVSLSMNGPEILTDADGAVSLPLTVQEWKWVHVSKGGYRRVSDVMLGGSRPVRVVLRPEPPRRHDHF